MGLGRKKKVPLSHYEHLGNDGSHPFNISPIRIREPLLVVRHLWGLPVCLGDEPLPNAVAVCFWPLSVALSFGEKRAEFRVGFDPEATCGLLEKGKESSEQKKTERSKLRFLVEGKV